MQMVDMWRKSSINDSQPHIHQLQRIIKDTHQAMIRQLLTGFLLLLSSFVNGQNKKEQLLYQQQTIDSLTVMLDSAAADLRTYRTRVLDLDGVIDRKEYEAARILQRMDSVKLRSLQLEKEVAQMTQREQERKHPPIVVDVSSAPACASYLKNKFFVGEHWDGDLYLNFDQNGTVSATKEQCGEWELKKLPKLSGTIKINPEMGWVKQARSIHFGPNQEAKLCGDGTLIWAYEGTNVFMTPANDLLSVPDKAIEVDAIFLDAGGNDDVGEKLMFIIHSNQGYRRYVLEDATFSGPNPEASQELYLDLGDGMPPSYAHNPSMIGQRFILSIVRGESYPEYSGEGPEPDPYPADVIIAVRAIDQ